MLCDLPGRVSAWNPPKVINSIPGNSIIVSNPPEINRFAISL
jgi:hypothetical protein